MLIEIDNAGEEIIIDGVRVSFQILKALSHPDGSFYRMQATDDGVLVTRYPVHTIMVDPSYEST